MNNETIFRMNAYFDEQISLCVQKEKVLLTEERRDEANFEKVRANIFDIFRTVLCAAEKACKGDPFKTKEFFEEKMIQIPSNWETAIAKAKQHGDSAKMHIEQLKLDTVREIRETLSKIQGEI